MWGLLKENAAVGGKGQGISKNFSGYLLIGLWVPTKITSKSSIHGDRMGSLEAGSGQSRLRGKWNYGGVFCSIAIWEEEEDSVHRPGGTKTQESNVIGRNIQRV